MIGWNFHSVVDYARTLKKINSPYIEKLSNFVKDIMDGYGTYHWPDGKSYLGYWKEGLMHTSENQESTFTWPDGRKYIGEFKKNIRWKGNQFDRNENLMAYYFENVWYPD